MAEEAEFVTVFRSGDSSAEEDAIEARERLAQAGINAVVLGDDAPGVIEGTSEVRVPAPDQARAEAILATPTAAPEDEDEVTEEGLSHDLDFVSIFSSQGPEADMEAISIHSLLEASGIPSTVIGSAQFPSLPFEVRVPKSRAEEARTLIEEARQSGPAVDSESA
jgi:hypothetical protein